MREKRYHSCKHYDDRRNERIAISNVREFMRKDTLEFAPIQDGEKSRVHRNRRVFFVAPGRKGVWRGIVDDIKLGHGKACGDRKVFNDIPKFRIVVFFDLMRVYHGKHELVAPPITPDIHDQTKNNRKVKDVGISIHLGKNKPDRDDKHEKCREENPRLPDICRLLRIQRGHIKIIAYWNSGTKYEVFVILISMFKSHTPLSAKTAFKILSVLIFFFSAQVSLTIYVDSSYLASTIAGTPSLANMRLWDNPERMVGTLYTFASLLTILALLYAPRILRKVGNYHWTLSALIIHVLILLGLAMSNTAWLIIPLFMVEAALISVLYFNFDIFLERYSNDTEMGKIRGFFMVIGSIAWLLPPFFAGIILDKFGFQLVYLVGAAIVLPTVFLMIRYFSNFQDLNYDNAPLFMTKDDEAKHPDIHHILIANFFLQFFYAWMIIYAPLYFHNHLGVSYQDFGVMLTIALSAFVIFPYPAGWIADKFLGEKELLVGGFFLMAATSALVPMLGNINASIPLFAFFLFIGRTGASIVETMSETYFFKKIDRRSASLIGHFRRSRPLAFIVAPIIASVLLEFNLINMNGLFYLLAGIMAIAIYFPLRLRDTK